MSKTPSDGSSHRKGSAEASPGEFARLALLTAGSAKEKLAVVAEGDPLGLFAIGSRRVEAQWLLLDPNRVYEESVFVVVALSHRLSREDELEPWLVKRVDEAIKNLLRRDREGERTAEAATESAEYLRSLLELETKEAFAVVTRFNSLTERTRRIYFALIVEGRPIAECLEMGLGSLAELRSHAVLAVDVLVGRSWK